MDFQTFRAYCNEKPGAEETFPFDLETLVFKVGGKMFALTDIHAKALSVSLKCDPLRAEDLRSQFSEVQPGYHLNKRHWNTVDFSGKLPDTLLFRMVDHSFELVFASLSKSRQKEILEQA